MAGQGSVRVSIPRTRWFWPQTFSLKDLERQVDNIISIADPSRDLHDTNYELRIATIRHCWNMNCLTIEYFYHEKSTSDLNVSPPNYPRNVSTVADGAEILAKMSLELNERLLGL